ncbi:MAG: hypothetical protein NTW96_05810, partial [Planctomycetia bacterium]|nr:hypothetical protein [Planctomycetia bacterium]
MKYPLYGCIRAIPAIVAGALLIVVGLAAATGCSRAFYRTQADRDVYGLEDCASGKVDTDEEGYSIQPSPKSRMFDPNCPDLPPMPPDDPVSHELMRCVDGKRGWPFWKCYGNTPYVENPQWEAFLPRNDKGRVVLDRQAAVELALVNSPDYQQQL